MRELSTKERDVLMNLWHETSDWSLYHVVVQQVKSLLTTTSEVVEVKYTPKTPKRIAGEGFKNKKRKRVLEYNPIHEASVQVKLSDGTVASISLERVFQVKAVSVLSGWRKEAEMRAKKWYVYVVRCADESLYCGVTTDVSRRVEEHNTSPKGAKYTRSRRPVALIKSWPAPSQSEAVKAELRFKSLSKDEKERTVSR